MARQLNLMIYGEYSDLSGDYNASYLILHNVSSILLISGNDDQYNQKIIIICDGRSWKLKPSKKIENIKFINFMDRFMKFDYRKDLAIVEKEDIVVSVDLNKVLDVYKFEIDF